MMKEKNKRIIYGLGGVFSIAPLPLVGIQLSNKETSKNILHNFSTIESRLYTFTKAPVAGALFSENIYQTSNGKIWLRATGGTFSVSSDGGESFTKIDGLPMGFGGLIQTSNGKIWLDGGVSGLYVSSDGGDSFTKEVGLPDKIGGVYETLNGKIWVDGGTTGLYVSSDGGVTFTKVSGLQGQHYKLRQTSNGKIWLIDGYEGLYVSSDGGDSFTKVPGVPDVTNSYKIYQTSNGKIWLLNGDEGLYVSSDGGDSFTKVVGVLGHVLVMYQTSNGKIWVSTTGTFWISSNGGDSFTKVTAGLPENVFGEIYQTTNGDIWADCGSGKGLWVSSDGGDSFTKVKGLPENNAGFEVYQTSNGKIWVIDEYYGLYIDPITYSYKTDSTHFVGEINSEWNIISNKDISITISAPVQKVNFDGHDYDVTPTKFIRNIDVGKHNVIVTFADSSTYSFAVWVKKSTTIDNSDFSTESSYILEQYNGYINADKDRTAQVKYVHGNSGQAELCISLNNSDITVDYTKSNYQLVNTSFTPLGTPIELNPIKTTIDKDGMYLLTITDLVGNVTTYYVQIGGATANIPNTPNEDDNFTTTPGAIVKQNISIDGTTYDYVSNKEITFSTNNKSIDHITVNGSTSADPKLVLLTGNNKKFEIKTYNLAGSINHTYEIYIKEQLDLNSAFNATGSILNQYQGYLNGDITKEVSVLEALQGTGQATINVAIPKTEEIDTTNSFYQSVDASFNPIGGRTNLNLDFDTFKTTINKDGIYLLTINDLFGNVATYYVQIGGTNDTIPTIPDGGIRSLEPSSLIPTPAPSNSKFAIWKIITIAISGAIGIGIIVLVAIKLRPKKAKPNSR